MHDIALITHIAIGVACVAVAPFAISGALRAPTPSLAERSFTGLVTALCLAAGWLSLTEPARLWPFLAVSSLTFGFAARAHRGARGEGARARIDRLAGAGGATIALLTAILVVSATFLGPVAWILPAAIGAPILHRAERRLADTDARASGRPLSA